MNTTISQLKKYFGELTLKKIVVATIVLICFILLVRLLFKNNVLEGFQDKTLEDMALIKYELREYADTDAEREGQIVWDNRIYLMQPGRKNDPKLSFWNINQSDKLNYINDTNPVTKSLGSGINTIDNDSRPTKPAMVVTNGKYKTFEKYTKIAEVGNDEFNNLDLNYVYLRTKSFDDLNKIKEFCAEKIPKINNLIDYYDNVLKIENSDVEFVNNQIEKFADSILSNSKLYVINGSNPLKYSNDESPTLYNIYKNYNGVYQSAPDLKNGLGTPIAFSNIPFGSTLSLFSESNYSRLGKFVDLSVSYQLNDIYRNKIIKANKNITPISKNKNCSNVTTTTVAQTFEQDISEDYVRNYDELKKIMENILKEKEFTLNNKEKNRAELYRAYGYGYYNHGYRTYSINRGKEKNRTQARINALRDFINIKNTSNDINEILLPHTYNVNKWLANINHKWRMNWYIKGLYGESGSEEGTIETISNYMDLTYDRKGFGPDKHKLRAVDYGFKGYGDKNLYPLYCNKKPDFEINYDADPNTGGGNVKFDIRNFMGNETHKDWILYYNTPLLDISKDIGDMPVILQNMDTYKTKDDPLFGNLKLVTIDVNSYVSDIKINLINTDRDSYLSELDLDTIQDTDSINEYLEGDSKLDFSDNAMNNIYTDEDPTNALIQNPEWKNLEEDTMTNKDFNDNIHYNLFSYEIHPLLCSDDIINEVGSWQINISDLRENIINDNKKYVEYRLRENMKNDDIKIEIREKKNFLIKNRTKLEVFIKFIEKVQKNLIPFPKLKIIRPIAPSGFRGLGDIILPSKLGLERRQVSSSMAIDFNESETDMKDYVKYQLQKYVAVPETCVKQVREWRNTDRIYQLKQDGKTLNFFRNPYTNTFRVTTSNNPPEGYIEKLVACVEGCDAVDNLIKTDECARKLYKTKKSIEGGSSITQNIADDEESKYYINKIKSRTSYIKDLSDKARELQLVQDKNTLINREYNRAKLQNYVDDQSRNISILSDKLKDGMNKVDMNLYMYPDNLSDEELRQIQENSGLTSEDGKDQQSLAGQIGSRQNTANTIKNLIDNTSLPQDTKNDLKNKVSDYQMMMDNQLISPNEYNQRVTKVLESCPEYDLSGLVKKDTIADVCYGCDI